MTIEQFPEIRTPIIRDAIVVDDKAAENADTGPLLDSNGNPILDDKGRGIYVD